MARRPKYADSELLSVLRRDLLQQGAVGFEVTATARELGVTSAAIHARLGTRDELVAEVWLEPRRRYVEAMQAALGLRDFEDSVARTILVPFERWREEPDATTLALSVPLELLVGHRTARTQARKLDEGLRSAVAGWRERWARRASMRDVWYALVSAPAADVLTRGDVETNAYTPLKPLPEHAELARRLRK